MGFLDILRGKRELKQPAPDRLFAMSTAHVKLDMELQLRSTGKAAIVFQPLATAALGSSNPSPTASSIRSPRPSVGRPLGSSVGRSLGSPLGSSVGKVLGRLSTTSSAAREMKKMPATIAAPTRRKIASAAMRHPFASPFDRCGGACHCPPGVP